MGMERNQAKSGMHLCASTVATLWCIEFFLFTPPFGDFGKFSSKMCRTECVGRNVSDGKIWHEIQITLNHTKIVQFTKD
jgi:hypothetical protein